MASPIGRRVRKQATASIRILRENIIRASAREFLDFLTNRLHDIGQNDNDDELEIEKKKGRIKYNNEDAEVIL